MIHPINPPIFMAPARSTSVYDSNPEERSARPSPLNLFGSSEEYYEHSRGFTYTNDGRRLRDGVPTTPMSPGGLWTNVFRRSLISRFRDTEESFNVLPKTPELDDGTDQTDDATPIQALRFPRPLAATDPKKQVPLDLMWVDLHAFDNAVSHRTEEFEIARRKERTARLVIRRGQSFVISMRFYRDFNPDTDQIQLVFHLGQNAAESKGTKAVLDVGDNTGFGGWAVKIKELKATKATLEITTPASAVIGCWTLNVITITRSEEDGFTELMCPVEGIYLLFNPWAKDDGTYLPNEEEREEYVLNDTGKIWRGTNNAIQPTVWSYGQFEDGILECCMILLEFSKIPLPLRASPVHVSRAVSQIVNSVDDNGVVEGNWTGEFFGGVPATAWTGSGAILRTFASTGRPVRYGQCWVFAGVVTTVLRCLGIPTRVVTNYSSAHDTDNSCTVDVHFEADSMKLLKELNTDSVWNFHVWNDCWMERPDLPPGYGGWQAVDATPQEKSEGVYRVGPASHRAIKEGEVAFGFDTAFLFAEVNADKCYWLVDGRKRATLNEINKDGIGKRIVTKRVGKHLLKDNEDLMDITSQYKHFEMTEAERDSVFNALLTAHSKIMGAYQREATSKDVEFSVDLSDSVLIGTNFTVAIVVENHCATERTVKLSLRINATLYTGLQGRTVKSQIQTLVLKPGERLRLETQVTPYDYLEKLMSQSMFLVSVFAHVLETRQVFTATDSCRLQKPTIEIEAPESIEKGERVKVALRMKNPLPFTLTGCKFMVEGSGLILTKEVPLRDTPSYAIAAALVELKPFKIGERALLVHFSSDQLQDIEGSHNISIRTPYD